MEQISVGTSPLPLNTWLHLAWTIDGRNGVYYMNGTNIIQGKTYSPRSIMRTHNCIGCSFYSSSPCFQVTAFVDDLKIFNRAFSQTEINSLFIL